MRIFSDIKIRNAIIIGVLCSVSYLAVYFVRSVLSAVAPQMIEQGVFTTEYIGFASSLFFAFYAVGQLINGMIGEKVKACYMVGLGLVFAGICQLCFKTMVGFPNVACITYGMTGFFLSMIYPPISRLIAENAEPLYAVRCSFAYTFASFLGAPLVGLVAIIITWKSLFTASSVAVIAIGVVSFLFLTFLEQKGIIKYNQSQNKLEKTVRFNVLIKHNFIKYILVSVFTGVIRTSVLFWLPTYVSQYLDFSADQSAAIFSVASFMISISVFLVAFFYERLHRNMDLTLLVFFFISAIAFIEVYIIKQAVLNIILLVVALVFSNCASNVIWCIYCPSLRDTGMVSFATGFLDSMSYISAAVSNNIFGNAVASIGWNNLILVWFFLMIAGFFLIFPYDKLKHN